MRVLPGYQAFPTARLYAILTENYAGFDDQDFLELFSKSMWCLRNAKRRFGENAEHCGHQPANLHV
jgi:hypothetical protein